MGTSADFFRHYRYGRNQALAASSGRRTSDVVLGTAVAFAALSTGLWFAKPLLGERYGIYLLAGQSLALIAGILAATLVVAAVPAAGAYRQSLNHGLQI